ncbi:12562_t:CDS:2, partial [Racocetra fulgida]
SPLLSRFGSCVECLEPCSGFQWCSTCEVAALKRKFSEWTSGNMNVDYMIQQTQLLSNDGVGYLEFIPFEDFEHVKYIERGAFNCFGVTRDPTGCYMFVTKFYEYGNLQEFLTKTMGCLCWRDIIDMLWGMVSGGLERIHDNGFYHGNLHCGNLLIEEHPESIHLKISDIGLHGPADGTGSGFYGVLPYVAPEVLKGKGYTQESDIYSFGIIMWTLSSFVPPFCQYPHDLDLAKRICDGIH